MKFYSWLYRYHIGRQELNTILLEDLECMYIQGIEPGLASMLNDEKFMDLMFNHN